MTTALSNLTIILIINITDLKKTVLTITMLRFSAKICNRYKYKCHKTRKYTDLPSTSNYMHDVKRRHYC